MPQPRVFEYNTREAVAKTISNSLGVESKLSDLAAGLISPGLYMPENKQQYNQFRRFLHDILCFSLIDNGLFQGYELRISDLSLDSLDKRIRMQKPDLYKISGNSLHIGEVTATYSPSEALKIKEETYSDLVKFYQSSGLDVTFSVIVVDLSDPEWDLSFPSISDVFKNMIFDFMDTLRVIHSDLRFNGMRQQETKRYNIEKMNFVFEDNHMVDLVETSTGVRSSSTKIKSLLSEKDSEIDQTYIDTIASSIISDNFHDRPTPKTRAMHPHILIDDFEKMKKTEKTTTKKPKILQLGLPSYMDYCPVGFEDSIKILRTTNKFGGYLDYIKSSLQMENLLDDHLIHLNITMAQLTSEQMSGPGRKNYLKRNGLKSERKEPTHIGIDETHVTDLENLINDINTKIRVNNLRELDVQDSEQTGLIANLNLMNIEAAVRSSNGSSVAQFYQSLSKEITLNSMRRRKTRQYALGYSGFLGVYFLVAPGPQLRTESNIEFVKIISLVPPFTNPYSALWDSVGDHWESNWLSVDIDRLKHWQRAYDKSFLTTVTNSERLVRPGVSLMESVKTEVKNDNHTLFVLTYIENKQLTSTTNQTIRYLWMKSLGDKSFEGVLAKFPKRISSIIQSFMLQRSISSVVSICNKDLTDIVTVGRTMRDEETGNYDESTTGVVSLLPRIFTFGQDVPISYNLNEIYWCMGYNKDRQNPTQDAMNILSKILKEERLYDIELSTRSDEQKVDYFFGNTTISSDIKHIRSKRPESHYYSSKAVQTGIKLQDIHSENQGDRSSWLTESKLDAILGKNLSEYATFKASVKQIKDYIDKDNLNEVKAIGVRTKAIELIAEVVKNENLITALDVITSYSGHNNSNFEVFIQIFKKNQVGGVREIIILFIKARVLINILEEVSRLLAKSDRREILTKGRDKRLMMRADYESVMASFPESTPIKMIKESYDMSTWCQKFIPTIFSPIFEHHFKDMKPLKDFSRFVLLSHCNKKMEYPRKLVEQWLKHPEIKHDEVWMQEKKNKFLSDSKPWFYNHSNMCQGILHYCSTVLALSCLSLRDALFESCLDQLKMEKTISWKTRVGSDDKGTIIGLDLSKKYSTRQYLLLGQCERASERLHSMELSVKSTSGHLMYELNSAFMANLETLSPTIKFALSAVDLIGTTSCTSFVNESYSRIRQLRENGASSIVCSLAHSLNSQHFYDIFATRPGGENDLSKAFGLPFSKIPYDFGVYPLYDIDIQDVIGPEFYNYRLLKENPESIALKLLYTEISKDTLSEMFQKDDAPLLKKDHFGINQGLVKQLAGMRSRLGCDPVKINEYFINNPFLVIRGPEDQTETFNTIVAKLYTKGAAEALRRTSPAIYIGRLSAFRTSKSWNSPFQNQESFNVHTEEIETTETFLKTTYIEFIQNSIKKVKQQIESNESVDLKLLKHLLFPQSTSFEIVHSFVGKFGPTRKSEKKFSQAIRTWTVNNFNYEYNSTLKNILETSFGQSQIASHEDVNEFRSLMRMELKSLDQFKEDCLSRGIRPLDMFFYMTKLHKLSKVSKIQSFGNGPSTNGLHMTILSLKKYNHMPGLTMELDHGIDQNMLEFENVMSRKLDNVKLLSNIIIMKESNDLILNQSIENVHFKDGRGLTQDCLTTIRSIKSISGFDRTTQKTLLLVACEILDKIELKEKLLSWKTLNYTYIKKQKRTLKPNGEIQWSGDLSVLVNSDNECYTINQVNGFRYVMCKEVKDLSVFYQSLRQMLKTLSMEFNSFITRRPVNYNSIFLSTTMKTLMRSEVSGVMNDVLNIKFSKLFTYKKLSDMNSFKIVKLRNEKTKEIQIYLEERGLRTATICHSNGNLYPVEVSSDLIFNSQMIYNGVRFSTLMKNRSWFYDFKLPKMTTQQVVNFINDDVDIPTVLQLEDSDKKRIIDYLEVHTEANEETFGVTWNNKVLIEDLDIDVDDMDESSFADLFRRTMEETTMPSSLTNYDDPIRSWVEDVEENSNLEFNDLMNGEIDNNVIMTRSLAYKRPQRKLAMHTVSSLQHGSILKNRILNCFFTSCDVRRERRSQLPHMLIWLKNNKDRILDSLYEGLTNMIIEVMHENTGTDKKKIALVISKSVGQYEIPIEILDSILNKRSANQTSLIDMILMENDDLEEETDSEMSGVEME